MTNDKSQMTNRRTFLIGCPYGSTWRWRRNVHVGEGSRPRDPSFAKPNAFADRAWIAREMAWRVSRRARIRLRQNARRDSGFRPRGYVGQAARPPHQG